MTKEEFSGFENEHPTLEHTIDKDGLHVFFRDPVYPFYEKEENATRITREKFEEMSVYELEDAIYRGLNIEHITRVTGYFVKTSQMNKGKQAELRDRKRTPIR